MAFTAKHVEEALESFDIVYSSDSGRWSFEPCTKHSPGFSWTEFGYALDDKDPIIASGLGVITGVVVDSGHEGHGEYCELVFKLTLDDGTEQYFKKVGYYASFYGTDWDGGFYEVKPTEKVVTVYPRLDS
jgi:hypothetical protein